MVNWTGVVNERGVVSPAQLPSNWKQCRAWPEGEGMRQVREIQDSQLSGASEGGDRRRTGWEGRAGVNRKGVATGVWPVGCDH